MPTGEDFPSVASKQAELSHGLAKNFSNAQKSKQTFHKSGITKDRQQLKTIGNFSKYQMNWPKTIGPFTPTRAPWTKAQTLKFYMLFWNIKSLYILFLFSYMVQLQNVEIKQFPL